MRSALIASSVELAADHMVVFNFGNLVKNAYSGRVSCLHVFVKYNKIGKLQAVLQYI
jgi:hypothetical protein